MLFHFFFIPFERFDCESDFLMHGSCSCELVDILDAVNTKRINTLSICEMHNHANDYLGIGSCLSITVVDTSIISVTAVIHNPNTISKIQKGVLTGFSLRFDSEKHCITEIAIIDAPTFQDDSSSSQQSTSDGSSAEDLELFIKSVNHRRLLYLWMLRARGYTVNHEEIARFEAELYPDLQEIDRKDRREISRKDVDELQLELSLVDPQPNTDSSFTKVLLFRLEHTTVRMRKEGNHSRPHFHIQYKNQYSASYAVDNFELLAGNMPAKYEKLILAWAAQNQKSLKVTWEKLQAGEDVRELISAENQA